MSCPTEQGRDSGHGRPYLSGYFPCTLPAIINSPDLTDPGELVIDPFCGSGTTLVAAKLQGRRSVGIECQQKYVDTARKRLANTQEQTELRL